MNSMEQQRIGLKGFGSSWKKSVHRWLVFLGRKRFAADLGVCQATIHKYLYEKPVPSGKRMMQIHVMTEGDVTLVDWIDHFGDHDGKSVEG